MWSQTKSQFQTPHRPSPVAQGGVCVCGGVRCPWCQLNSLSTVSCDCSQSDPVSCKERIFLRDDNPQRIWRFLFFFSFRLVRLVYIAEYGAPGLEWRWLRWMRVTEKERITETLFNFLRAVPTIKYLYWHQRLWEKTQAGHDDHLSSWSPHVGSPELLKYSDIFEESRHVGSSENPHV